VFAGVRKLSDAATGQILETSTSTDTNNGTVFLRAPSVCGKCLRIQKPYTVTSSVYTCCKLSCADLEHPHGPWRHICPSRRLAHQRHTGRPVHEDQGTGNYLAYQMFIGARAGTSYSSTATSTSLSPASEQTLTRAQSKRLRNTSAPSRQNLSLRLKSLGTPAQTLTHRTLLG
jgi:hypothetical protein